MSKYLSALYVVFIGGCILIGFWFVSSSINSKNVETPSSNHQYTQLLNRSELAEYLGISETEVEKLSPQLIGTGTSSIIPYVRIGDITYYPVKAIDNWLSEIKGLSVE